MFFTLHILLMAVATLGVLGGVGAAMFSRNHKNWLKIHKAINFSSLVAAVAGITCAVLYLMTSSGKHLSGFHQWIGLAAAISGWFALFWGFNQFKAKNKSAARTMHRLVGRVCVLLFLSAVILGLKLIHII
jgi:uncharacterized membrane protein